MKRYYAILAGCNKLEPKIIMVSEQYQELVDKLELGSYGCTCGHNLVNHEADPDDGIDYGRLCCHCAPFEPALPESYSVKTLYPTTEHWYRLYSNAHVTCPHPTDRVYIIGSSQASDDMNIIMKEVKKCIF